MSEPTSQLFSANGLRCTRQRQAIYEALCANRTHPTADELFHQLSDAPGQDHAGISLATVYNTLEALCQAGLVLKLMGAGDNGSARYDAARGNHLHLRCQQTGAVADVPDDLSERLLDRIPSDLIESIESELGFEITQVHIELRGRWADPAART